MSRGKGEWEALCEIRGYCMNTILCVTCFISQHQRHLWLKCGWYKTLDMQLKCSVAFTMTTLKSLFHLWDLLRTLNLVPCWLSGTMFYHATEYIERAIESISQPFGESWIKGTLSEQGRELRMGNLYQCITPIFTFIYIYAFSRRFYPKRLTLHSSYSFYVYRTHTHTHTHTWISSV